MPRRIRHRRRAQGKRLFAGEGEQDLDPADHRFAAGNSAMQLPLERQPDDWLLGKVGNIQGEALLPLELFGLRRAEGAHIDLDMQGAARRLSELELDAVDFRDVGFDRAEAARDALTM